jgi:hypothetical protein
MSEIARHGERALCMRSSPTDYRGRPLLCGREPLEVELHGKHVVPVLGVRDLQRLRKIGVGAFAEVVADGQRCNRQPSAQPDKPFLPVEEPQKRHEVAHAGGQR